MAIVVDASLMVVVATRDARVDAVERHLQAWIDQGEDLHAPSLLPYEVANALTRLVAAGQLPVADVVGAWAVVEKMPLQLHPLTAGPQVIDIARRLGRASAYDAAYLLLTQQLGAELWTLDGPLARNAAGLGFPVHLVS